jgi:hypothetical protein
MATPIRPNIDFVVRMPRLSDIARAVMTQIRQEMLNAASFMRIDGLAHAPPCGCRRPYSAEPMLC